ncbi:MAG: hypothetical protein H7Y88_02180 [Phycisphaerales bacterium]|nr:hypothetical protein [Phycisphaerales bacterium]
MAAFRSGLGEYQCYRCRYLLSGLGRMGMCPECGERFDTNAPVSPPFSREVARAYGGYGLFVLLRQFAMTWRSAAIIALVVAHTVIIVWPAYAGWEKFLEVTGL